MGCKTTATVSNGGGGSCDLSKSGSHTCTTYSAAENECALGICSAQTACTDEGGTWGSSCPSGMLGTCTLGANEPATTYYAGSGVTAMSAQQGCTAEGGTWAAGK
jgi:hypothetical protein